MVGEIDTKRSDFTRLNELRNENGYKTRKALWISLVIIIGIILISSTIHYNFIRKDFVNGKEVIIQEVHVIPPEIVKLQQEVAKLKEEMKTQQVDMKIEQEAK